MKILLARMSHETNTFSPIATPLAAFEDGGPLWGQDAYARHKGMRTPMAAFIDVAERVGAEITVKVTAATHPSGPVAAEAFSAICDLIVDAAPSHDGILLSLHGAMVSEQSSDGEGELLERIRTKCPGIPIGIAFDLHGNLTQKIVDNADVMGGFRPFPHFDMYECGERGAPFLFDMLSGRAKPVVAWRQLPILANTLMSATGHGAMRRAVESGVLAETQGMLAVSIFAGFPLADIPRPFVSVVVVGNGDRGAADETADRIADQIWDDREGFTYESEPLSESVSRAKGLAARSRRPVLLIDHGDNCTSGGTCDTMDAFVEATRQGLDGLIFGPVCDREAVAQLMCAGIGARTTIELGNKVPIPKIGSKRKPIRVSGVVRALTDGRYVVTGPTYTGQEVSMGRCAVLDTGTALIVISEKRNEPWDLGVFESVGIDPRRARFILLKSRMYCRPVFEPIVDGVVECDSRGVTSSDSSLFVYENLERPFYPLDDMRSWRAP